MDTLAIIGLDAWTRVGCTAEERAFPQRLELDAVMELPLAAAGRRDDMAGTVDYAAVAAALASWTGKGEFRLAEAVAEGAAALILKEFRRVRRVTIRIRKRALPGIRHAEVTLTRARGRM
jgi:dihydroneopterin aldolase